MIPKIIEIGPLTFHIYGLIIGIAALTGWYVTKSRAHYYKIDKKIFDDWVLIIPLLTSIIGARLYHVLDYWSIYSKNPIDIIKIQNGGLGIWGAIAGGIVAIYYICKAKNINFLRTLDLVAPSMALAQAIGRLGNWINQEGFGPPTTLPWKVYIEPQNRPYQYILTNYFHPTFFYEAALNLVVFVLLICLGKKFNKPGQIFAFYLIFYSTARFFLEFLRLDTWTIGAVKIAQILSAISIIAGTTILFLAKSHLDRD